MTYAEPLTKKQDPLYDLINRLNALYNEYTRDEKGITGYRYQIRTMVDKEDFKSSKLRIVDGYRPRTMIIPINCFITDHTILFTIKSFMKDQDKQLKYGI